MESACPCENINLKPQVWFKPLKNTLNNRLYIRLHTAQAAGSTTHQCVTLNSGSWPARPLSATVSWIEWVSSALCLELSFLERVKSLQDPAFMVRSKMIPGDFQLFYANKVLCLKSYQLDFPRYAREELFDQSSPHCVCQRFVGFFLFVCVVI